VVLYGGVRLILELGHNTVTGFEFILKILGQVGDLLEIYSKYEDLYRFDSEVRAHLVRSYRHIIIFWHNLSKVLDKRSAKNLAAAFFKPLNSKLQECKEQFQQDISLIQSRALVATELQNRRERVETERSKIRQWIAGGKIPISSTWMV
jgi:hypothetical protein